MLFERLTVRSLLALTAIGIGACTLSTETTATQCRSQDDCLSRGPEFANTTCSAQRVCVQQAIVEKACTKNAECIERNGGAPYTCRKNDGRCVPLLSNECPLVFGSTAELLNDNAVYVGVTGPPEPAGTVTAGAIEFARDEFKRTVDGLPPTKPGGPRRPVIAIFCNAEAVVGGGTIATAEAQANHIADIRAPVLIGNISNSSQLPTVNRVILPRQLLHLASSGLQEFTDLVDNDLVFRMRTPNLLTKGLIQPYIAAIEARAEGDGVRLTGEPLRVAVARTSDPTGLSMSNATVPLLNFNGKDAQTNLAEGNLKIFDYGNPNDKLGQPDAYQKIPGAITGIQAFAPHVIIHCAPPPSIGVFFGPMMRTWPAGTQIPYTFAFLDFWTALVGNAMGAPPAMNDLVRKRYTGVRNTGAGYVPADEDALNLSIAIFRPDLATLLRTSPFGSFGYDSFYVFALAATAIGDEPLIGANLAKGVRKLTTGERINWGSADLPKALTILQNGGSIEYRGVQGLYNFDANGDRAGVSEAICLGTPPARAITGTGFKYDQSTNTVTGSLTLCP
jgi:hypothetical protein